MNTLRMMAFIISLVMLMFSPAWGMFIGKSIPNIAVGLPVAMLPYIGWLILLWIIHK